jgi:hypothetical protein
MSRCHHVFVKGDRKGEQCKTTVRSGAPFCSKHCSSTQATTTQRNEPTLANASDVPAMHAEPPQPNLHIDPSSSSNQLPPPSSTSVYRDTTVDARRDASPHVEPTTTNPPITIVEPRPTSVHVQKYPASNPSHTQMQSTPSHSTRRCDIFQFMNILESHFQKSATLV